jgi:hypothetical protein
VNNVTLYTETSAAAARRSKEAAKAARRVDPKRFTFAPVPNWLLERHELSAGAKLCYARLIQHAGHKGVAWPRQWTLGEELGTNDRQVRRWIEELEQLELIEVEREEYGGINHYFFLKHPWMDAGD